tara:strand:+ start:1655 stop:1762 length:108 start_codon:yes stop_codon:yes gene_type:complete
MTKPKADEKEKKDDDLDQEELEFLLLHTKHNDDGC